MADIRINLAEALQEKLRMRYLDHSILPFADNTIVRNYFQDRSSTSDEEIQAMNIMNPNIAKTDIRLIVNQGQTDSYAPKHFTNAMLRHIMDDLGVTPTKEDLEKVKALGLKVAIIGYGGAMINMLYNLTLWQHELSVTGIFDRMIIFESDNIEFTNLMRLGKEVVFEYHPKTPNVETDVTALPKLMLIREEKELVRSMKPNLLNRWMTAEDAEFLAKKDYIFIGAPTFDARVFLQDKNFYFVGHGNTEVDVTFAPEVNTSIGNETYGTIDIPVLILNLHIATAAWIKHMASGAEVPFDTDIFRFDMKAYIDAHPEVLDLADKTIEEAA